MLGIRPPAAATVRLWDGSWRKRTVAPSSQLQGVE